VNICGGSNVGAVGKQDPAERNVIMTDATVRRLQALEEEYAATGTTVGEDRDALGQEFVDDYPELARTSTGREAA
jgi:hypothetical protein